MRSQPKLEQLRMGILFALAALSIILFAAYLALALDWRSKPFLGVTVNHQMVVNAANPNTGNIWSGLDVGLQTGDRILYLGDQIMEIDRDRVRTSGSEEGRYYLDILGNYEVGSPIQVTFERPVESAADLEDLPRRIKCGPENDGKAVCTVTYILDQIPDGDFLALFFVPYISGLTVLAMGLFLLWMRPRDQHAFYAIGSSLTLALYLAGLFDVGTTHRLLPVSYISGIGLGGLAISLGLIFPNAVPFVRRRPWLRFIPLGLSAVLAAAVLLSYRSETPEPLGFASQTTGLVAVIGLAILATLLYFYQRPRATSTMAHHQANTLFLGLMVALAPAILWGTGRFLQVMGGTSSISFSIEAASPFFVMPAVSFVYALLQYRPFDTDRALSQAITYTIMLITLIMGYTLMVAGASIITIEGVAADSPLLIVLTIFLLSVVFIPLRTRLQRRIEAIYYRTRYNYQERLESFSQRLTSMVNKPVMIHEFRTLLGDTISPINVLVFLFDNQSQEYVAYGDPAPETDIIFGTESGIVQLLRNRETTIYLQPGSTWPSELYVDRDRLRILQVMVLAGIPGSDQLNGFVCVGPPLSQNNAYTFEELRFINNLVGQLSVGIERAKVIESLERRVRELDVFSQVSQAVNFTIEFNDLIELISAQTLKLIPSAYFHIALYEPSTDQFYFVFYLEHDERLPEREDVKWSTGIDLYSEVIRSGTPIREDSYIRSMAQRNSPLTFENPLMRAWMGVPLMAGTRAVGVMAIGEEDPELKYTPEQLRIFSDIATLAATALENARLFNDANVRARQLAVLNDISRQLVATEGDVERLLDLIVASAVDILNTEAGSLLLTVEDGSNDLEFRVATGGKGEQLIGTRLKAGYGLVGKVAETGKHVISNDISQDESWQGEIGEGSEFATESVLAVPLVTKDRVVGVLEVINKKDGSAYVEEDVELLTTFAGQAAVAIENARLFQQTDIQLNRRVQELEALERIDRELNRTLDLSTVAEITVRWAIANSNAMTGVLGVVTEDREYLEILAKDGYDENDVPEGAENHLWPLDRGIVKRVMRTRRPDLQPYVKMDPDYVPSLRDALSQITVPMLTGGEINAILILETNQEPRLNLLDQDWAQRLAEHASIAIANAQLYAELTRANETKSEFVAFAAHELKNPLTPIKGYASAMKGAMVTSMDYDQIQKVAGIIANNAERMQAIIDDLKDVAASDANKLKIELAPVSFRSVLVDTLIPFQNQIEEKQQTVINRVPDDLPLVMADPTRLIQVLTNFVSNAHKYSPPEASITLEAWVRDRYVNRRNENVGPVLQFAISDTGIGMNENDLRRIFREDYFRSEEAKVTAKGTGLGMMITRRIIEGHNGEVWVESEVGKGTTFSFVIPLVSDPVPVNGANGRHLVEEPASD